MEIFHLESKIQEINSKLFPHHLTPHIENQIVGFFGIHLINQ